MINNAVLTGRMVREAELKYTSSGTAVANFTLAVDRRFKNANGERETDFINCVAWRKTAEILAEHTGKGSLIGVEGNIQTRNYENSQGQKVYVTEVVVDNFTFLESKGSNQQSQNSQPQRQQNTPEPFEKTAEPISISNSDLPF